jgi:hypothetical protein
VHGQLVDEHRPHATLLEVARVEPVVGARDLHGALGVADDLVLTLEQQLLDVFIVVDVEETVLGARTLVFDRLAIYVPEHVLEELPSAIQVAAMKPPDADFDPLLGLGFSSKVAHAGPG